MSINIQSSVQVLRLDPTFWFCKAAKENYNLLHHMLSLSFIAFMIHEMVHFLRNFFIPRLPGHAGQRNNAKDRFITKVIRKYNRKQKQKNLCDYCFANLYTFTLVLYIIIST